MKRHLSVGNYRSCKSSGICMPQNTIAVYTVQAAVVYGDTWQTINYGTIVSSLVELEIITTGRHFHIRRVFTESNIVKCSCSVCSYIEASGMGRGIDKPYLSMANKRSS